jgi:protein-S-isoprenylcysteine O-methyltransferase Ste14
VNWLGRFPRHRILVSRLFALGLLLLYLCTARPLAAGRAAEAAYWTGFLLVMGCMLGRLWSLLYLSGYKTRLVVEAGPFSVTRNPLYLFSFMGAAGLALVANHLWLALALLGAFALYYPFVVRSEEEGLKRELGAAYEDYCRRVPRFWPRWSRYQRPEAWEVRLKSYDQAWRDALWFPLAFLLLSLLRQAQAAGWLPLCGK